MRLILFLILLFAVVANASTVEYFKNGVSGTVKVDTVTPANSFPLPVQYNNLLGVRTDLSTEATQVLNHTELVSANTNLVLIDSDIVAMSAKLPATLGQKTSANSLSMVLSSDTVLPLPTGSATAANQVTGNGYLSSIDTKTPALVGGSVPVTGPLTDTQLRATAVPVSGPLTDTQLRATAVPVSAASLPLPTGAATETTLAAASAKLPATLGQKTSAASMAVVLASDQSSIQVKSAINVTGSGSCISNLTTSAQTFTAPANAVGFVIMAISDNSANLRFIVGTTATSSLGLRLEPGRDSGYIPLGANISVIAESGSSQVICVQWIAQ